MKLLIVEDHSYISELIKSGLKPLGHVSDIAENGRDALHLLSVTYYDAVILDLGLPDIEGIELLNRIRSNLQQQIPVVVVTARSSLESRLQALNIGADDYLIKPFEVEELEARLRAVWRRTQENKSIDISFGDLHYKPRQRQLSVGDTSLTLAKRESMLMEMLMRSAPRIVIKDNLEENLYSLEESASTNAVEALVSRMRKKLKELGSNCQIETKRGIGYNLKTRGATGSANLVQ